MPGKRALIVIGMHRSGTSAVTGALQLLGVQLGKKLYAAHAHINPKGYFEHDHITDLNDDALSVLGSAWDDVLLKDDDWQKRPELRPITARILQCMRRDFSRAELWALKDPRLCRLLPWWLDILAEAEVRPYFLFIFRSPDEVYQSLNRRDGFSQSKALLLWVLHYLEAERHTRGYPRAFVLFDHFLAHPTEELQKAEQLLGLNFAVAPETAAADLDRFLSKDLKHHHTGDARLQPMDAISNLAYKLESGLLEAAQNPGREPDPEAMDKLWRQMADLQKSFTPLIVDQLRAVNLSRGQIQLTNNRVLRSWYWYLGKPIRFMERLAGRNV